MQRCCVQNQICFNSQSQPTKSREGFFKAEEQKLYRIISPYRAGRRCYRDWSEVEEDDNLVALGLGERKLLQDGSNLGRDQSDSLGNSGVNLLLLHLVDTGPDKGDEEGGVEEENTREELTELGNEEDGTGDLGDKNDIAGEENLVDKLAECLQSQVARLDHISQSLLGHAKISLLESFAAGLTREALALRGGVLVHKMQRYLIGIVGNQVKS